jgi:hypothetical protein
VLHRWYWHPRVSRSGQPPAVAHSWRWNLFGLNPDSKWGVCPIQVTGLVEPLPLQWSTP